MRVENKPAVTKPSSKPADKAGEKKPSKGFEEVLQGRREAAPPAGKNVVKDAKLLGPLPGKTKGGSAKDDGQIDAILKNSRNPEEKAKADDGSKTIPNPALSAPQPFVRGSSNESVQQTGAAAPTRTIEKLADEIAVLTHADGSHEVQIEVDSKVLNDLRICVTQKDGEIQIKLMSDSAQTQRLLTEGMPQLLAALQTRHVPVTGVQVTPRVANPAAAESSRRFGRDRNRRDREGGRGR